MDTLSCPIKPRSSLPPTPDTDTVIALAQRAMGDCLSLCPDVETLETFFRIGGSGKVQQFSLIEPDACVLEKTVGECIADVAAAVCFEPSETADLQLLVDFPQGATLEPSAPVPIYLGHGPIMLEEPRIRFPGNIHAGELQPPSYVHIRYDVTTRGRVENTRVIAQHFEGVNATGAEFYVKVAVTAVHNARFLPAEDAEGRRTPGRGLIAKINFAR